MWIKFKGNKLIVTLLFFCMAMGAVAQTERECQQIILDALDLAKVEKYPEALEKLAHARTLAENNNWAHQKIIAINAIGITYNMMMEYGEALNYHLEGYKLALKEKDPKYRALVLGNIGSIYLKQKKYSEAEQQFKEIYAIYKANGNLSNLGTACLNLGTVMNQTGRLEEASKYLNEATLHLKDPEKIKALHVELLENELFRGNTFQVHSRAEALYEKFKDEHLYINPTIFLLIAAKAYLQEQHYEQAIASCEKLLSKGPDLEDKLETFQVITQAYRHLGIYDKAYNFKDSLQRVEYKLSELKNSRLYENSLVKLQVENYKHEITMKDERFRAERVIFYAVIAVFLAAVTLLVLLLRQRKLTAQRNSLLLENQLHQKEREQEQLQKEIEIRNRTLSARALFQSDRNQLLDALILELVNNPELEKLPNLVATIRSIKVYLKSDNEWDTFITHFEQVNPGFLNRLKKAHPNLSSNDMRFIAYTYMNLSVKEISSLLNITVPASKKRKERIAAKLDLPPDVSLYAYLTAF